MQIVIEVNDADGKLKDVGTSVPVDVRLLVWYLERAKDRLIEFSENPQPTVQAAPASILNRLNGGKPREA